MAKGITREKITYEAEKLIKENSLSAFSLHALAERLHIKTASLYTHVSGIEEVMALVSKDILADYESTLEKAVGDKKRADALHALAEAEREYALNNASFYELIMNLQLYGNPELADAASCIILPLQKVMDQYQLTKEQKIDASRAFRACVNGFLTQERHGYFSHLDRDIKASFTAAVDMLADGIEAEEDAD